jgi:hypothetical protein
MKTRLPELGLWAIAVGCVVAGAMAFRAPAASHVEVASFSLPLQLAPRDSDALVDAIGTIAEGNLFRPNRSAPDTTGMPVMVNGAPPPMQPPKPALRLRGILGGPPWDVLIEGVPGSEGAIVARVGQTLNGVTIHAVRRDTVIVRGMDTTWKLTIVNSWQ